MYIILGIFGIIGWIACDYAQWKEEDAHRRAQDEECERILRENREWLDSTFKVKKA